MPVLSFCCISVTLEVFHYYRRGGVSILTARECARLHAVVVHMGGMGGGHYVAYTRHTKPASDGPPDRPTEERWAYCSDSSTHWVAVEEVLRAEAYILFYSRDDQIGRHAEPEPEPGPGPGPEPDEQEQEVEEQEQEQEQEEEEEEVEDDEPASAPDARCGER